MFVQVIEGKVRDSEALQRQIDTWQRDLRPGAIGYLGSTGGCTSTGDCILIARFESADAARRNADRAEQTAWWRETEKLFEGDVRFHDTEDVQIMVHGDLDKAKFVQVMEGHVTDHDRGMDILRDSDEVLRDERPDLLGSLTVFFEDDEFAEVAYFSSEDEAREAERREMTGPAAEMFQEWQNVMHVERYIDLNEPWLNRA